MCCPKFSMSNFIPRLLFSLLVMSEIYRNKILILRPIARYGSDRPSMTDCPLATDCLATDSA